jgi:multicomponent Na+:H+ antiporter subunit C
VNLLLALDVGVLVAAGVYLALSRGLFRCVVGISLVGIAANLAMFLAARPAAPVPPIVPPGETVLAASATDPLPQALVLTAIVIGFALTCFSLVLVLAIRERSGHTDSGALRMAEPAAGADGKPAPMSDSA